MRTIIGYSSALYISTYVSRSCLLSYLSQAGDSPLPADLDDVVREYHCIQAYLVSTQAYWTLTQAYWALTQAYWALTQAFWALTRLLPRPTGLTGLLPRPTGLLLGSYPGLLDFYPSLCVMKSHYVQLLSVHFSQDANDAFSEWFQHIHSRRPVSHSQTHSARGEGLPLSLVPRPTLPGERVCHSVLFPDPLCQGRGSATQSCSQTHSAWGEGLPLSLVPRPTLPGERVCHSSLTAITIR